MAAGRTDQAVQLFGRVVDADSRADSGTLAWWRLTMARCAHGAALVRTGRTRDAREHLAQACPALERWGRADAIVKMWGKDASALRSIRSR